MNYVHNYKRSKGGVNYRSGSQKNVIDRILSQRNVMELQRIKEIVEELEGSEQTEFTPYGATKVINRAFGINLPPQMLYNYVKKGYITAANIEDRWVIKKSELVRFASKYALRNLLSL